MSAADDPALALGLQAAVPLRMAELRAMSYEQRWRTIRVWAADAAEVLASNGDTLMFRTKPWKLKAAQLTEQSRRRPGAEVSTAATFNHLACGLAALAYAPGGVLFAGIHWCIQHPFGLAVAGPSSPSCEAVDEPPPTPPADRPIRTVPVTGEVL